MRYVWIMLVGAAFGWIGVNAGTLIDVLAYRPLVAQAKAILPDDWRSARAIAPAGAQIDAVRRGMTETHLRALSAAHGRFVDTSQGGVLRLSHGFDTEDLFLHSGCFRHARYRLTFIVWHYNLRAHCL